MNSNKSKLLNITIGINFLACLTYNVVMIISLFQMSMSRLKDEFSTKSISVLAALVLVYFLLNLLLYKLLIKPDDIIQFGRYMGIAFIMLITAILCGLAISSIFFMIV